MTIVAVVVSLFSFAAGVAVTLFAGRRTCQKRTDSALAANNAFLSASANQLRTPLNQIVGSLQALDFQRAGLSEKQEQLLGILNEGSYNLRGALMDILDILDLQADRLTIEPVNVDFQKTVATLERRFANRANRKGLVLDFDTRKLSHADFELDQTRYIQCVSTLIAQCIKQTENGAIKVAFDLDAAGARGTLKAIIKDTSAGMDQYMTEAYFRPEKYDTSAEMMNTDGRRLSLMLARMLIAKMGGSLTAESAFGSGVEFRISIPVVIAPAQARAANQTHQKPVERARALLADKTILAVDDNVSSLMIVKALLAQGNVGTILTAQNGLEAVKIIAAHKCDLVLMDVQMPVVDGLTATREVRKCGKAFANVPIIAVTASVGPEDTENYREAGMDAVLAKPLIIDDLFETVERVLFAGKKSKAG